jgi:hypothetical protein
MRRGLASLATAATTNYATLQVAVDVNGTSVPAPPIRLLGPGEVTSIHAAAIVRTDPRDGADAFEPNYLAMVEVALPDLPWLFSPAAPNGARLRPWICLLVVVDGPGVALTVTRGSPAVLHLTAPFNPTKDLPDLTTVDAWAHAQVTVDSTSGAALDGSASASGPVDCRVAGPALNAALSANTSGQLARLIAPRMLAPNQKYIACIVPTYRAGVNAGLGQDVNAQDLAPAWDTTTTVPLQLPVYYYFRFQTGPGGDFASLASQIMPPAAKLDAGKRPVDVSAPGFGAAGVPNVTLQFEGAMRTQGEGPTDWPPGAETPYQTQLRNALAPPAGADPVVTPPLYGRTQSGRDLTGPSPPAWLSDLNLDPRMRAAAGAAAQVVQAEQEALVASAWDQLGEINKANQLLRQAQLACGASTSMMRRHLTPVAGDGVYLQITSPVHPRVRVTLGGAALTLRGHVAASRLPVAALTAPMRKLARPRGPLGRQLTQGKPPQLVDRLNLPASAGATALTAAGPVQAPRGMVALDDVSSDIQVKKMVAIPTTALGWITTAELATSGGTMVAHPAAPADARVAPDAINTGGGIDVGRGAGAGAGAVAGTGGGTGTGRIGTTRLIEWDSDPDVPALLKGTHAYLPAPFLFPTDTATLQKVTEEFRMVASAVNQYLNAAPALPPDPPPLGGSSALSPARGQLQARLDPNLTIAARFGARIPLGKGTDPLQPLSLAPQYPQPMYSALADLSATWMLPGVDKMPRNAAVLLQTNPRFVEAFMVGLNEAFAGELIWREFPVGRSATYFRNFWGGPVPDIPTIDSFDPSGHLGDHEADHATGGNLVLLIRADLFRRYPNTIVSAVQATWTGTNRQIPTTAARKWPLFRGSFGADLNFFGFDITDPRGPDAPTAGGAAGWYFVLEEHVTEPRFGLEPAEKTPLSNSWNDLRWSDVMPDRSFLNPGATPTPFNNVAWGAPGEAAWGQNAAAMAAILLRRPVRVAMHGRALIAAAGT